MKRKRIVSLAVVAVVLGGGYGAFRYYRGPSGATAEYGGTLEDALLPDFPSNDAAAWANGTPMRLAEQRGHPVLIEAWSPG
jgi:hypothetical protein